MCNQQSPNYQYEIISCYLNKISDMRRFSSVEDYFEYFLSELGLCLDYYQEHCVPASWMKDKIKFLKSSNEYIVFRFIQFLYNNFDDNFSGSLDEYSRTLFIPLLKNFILVRGLSFDKILVKLMREQEYSFYSFFYDSTILNSDNHHCCH